MNILITGINGFVGRYLVENLPTNFAHSRINIFGTYLDENHIFEELNNVKLNCLDITNREQVFKIIEKIKPDYVFHLAAQSSVGISWKNPNVTFEVNVNGTINLLDAIKEVNNDCKILIVGSSDEYGKVSVNPIKEDQQVNPKNPYAISKFTQELISKLYVDAYKMKIVLTRSFNHIGPMQEPIFVVSDWAKQIAEIELGLREPVINVGNIEVKRDFSDVRDIIKAYFMLIEQGHYGEIYNVGSGKIYSLRYILEKLLENSNISIKVNIDKSKLRPVENEVIWCDNSKIMELCQWKPEFQIEKSLLDVLNYWREKLRNK